MAAIVMKVKECPHWGQSGQIVLQDGGRSTLTVTTYDEHLKPKVETTEHDHLEGAVLRAVELLGGLTIFV